VDMTPFLHTSSSPNTEWRRHADIDAELRHTPVIRPTVQPPPPRPRAWLAIAAARAQRRHQPVLTPCWWTRRAGAARTHPSGLSSRHGTPSHGQTCGLGGSSARPKLRSWQPRLAPLSRLLRLPARLLRAPRPSPSAPLLHPSATRHSWPQWLWHRATTRPGAECVLPSVDRAIRRLSQARHLQRTALRGRPHSPWHQQADSMTAAPTPAATMLQHASGSLLRSRCALALLLRMLQHLQLFRSGCGDGTRRVRHKRVAYLPQSAPDRCPASVGQERSPVQATRAGWTEVTMARLRRHHHRPPALRALANSPARRASPLAQRRDKMPALTTSLRTSTSRLAGPARHHPSCHRSSRPLRWTRNAPE
jgi:hypothetical protein